MTVIDQAGPLASRRLGAGIALSAALGVAVYLIGLPSSGVHSNGLTLARRALLEDGGLSLDDRPEELGGASVADVLLEPTVIYVRAVLELSGIHDVLSKSLGSQNPINLVKATVAALRDLRSPDQVAQLRGLTVREVLGLEKADGDRLKPVPEGEAEETPA